MGLFSAGINYKQMKQVYFSDTSDSSRLKYSLTSNLYRTIENPNNKMNRECLLKTIYNMKIKAANFIRHFENQFIYI